MEWLTRELTAIEKVRRNVVLLAALSSLVAVFPVQTDQITFLGAKFTTDIVAFALFHVLAFYTFVLATRGLIHGKLAGFEQGRFELSIEAREKELIEQHQRWMVAERESLAEAAVAQEKVDREAQEQAHAAIAREMQRISRERQLMEERTNAFKENSAERAARAIEELQDLRQEIANRVEMQKELESGASKARLELAALATADVQARASKERTLDELEYRQRDVARSIHHITDRVRELQDAVYESDMRVSSMLDEQRRAFEREEAESYRRIDELRIAASRSDISRQTDGRRLRRVEDKNARRTRRTLQISEEGPFAQFVAAYVLVGEYLFPVAFGAVALVLLFITQSFPMLWELRLRVVS